MYPYLCSIGCGMHIEQALKDVPKDERCQCPRTSRYVCPILKYYNTICAEKN